MKNTVNTNNNKRDILTDRIENMPVSAPPAPWARKLEFDRSGLIDIGFADNSDLLLLVSWDERVVIDCLTGDVLAREGHKKLGDWHDQFNLYCLGVGPLSKSRVRTAGLWGGGLCSYTRDSWSLRSFYQENSWSPLVVLEPPDGDVRLPDEAAGCTRLEIPDLDTFRACGFSPTGKSIVAADASGVIIYGR